ncbi:MAG: DUF4363 family protein [Clostridia bacterium]|nr:DUF4363 family protein [Clostridia bacterium]
MRDFIVTVVIILIVFIPSYYSEKYLINTGNELVERLNVIKDEVEEDSIENMEELIKIKERWDEIEAVWNMLYNHINTDNIELSFTRLLISYGEKEKAECLVNLAEIVCLLEDTPRSERLSLENIF